MRWTSLTRNRLSMALIVMGGALSSPVWGAAAPTPVTPGRAVVVWQGPDAVDGRSIKPEWDRFCESLARSMTVGRGPIGAGVFARVTCLEPGHEIPRDARWRVLVKSGEDSVTLSARYMIPGKKTKSGRDAFRIEASMDLPPSPKAIVGLATEGLAELAAMRLMDGMAMGWWFDAQSLSSDGQAVRGGAIPRSWGVERVPTEMALYRLSRDDSRGLWVPIWIGKATLSSKSVSGPEWTLPEGAAEEIRRGGVWGKNWEGRHVGAGDYELAARGVYEPAAGVGTSFGGDFLRSIFAQARRYNRVGARYGKSILPGSDLLRGQQLIGVFGDIQYGRMAGWRLFVDRVPKVNVIENNMDLSIGSDRYLIGFALSIAPGFIVQRADVTPRVGYWSMRAVVPAGEDPVTGDTVIKDFDVTRAGSAGVEAGVELGGGLSAVRLWYSLDRGINLVGTSRGTAQATRYGVDVSVPMFPIGKLGATEIRVLGQAFAFGESVQLTSGESDSDADAIQVRSIGYVDAFAGVGMGVTW